MAVDDQPDLERQLEQMDDAMRKRFVLGCAARVAPVVEAWGSPTTIAMYRQAIESMEAATDRTGPLSRNSKRQSQTTRQRALTTFCSPFLSSMTR